MGKGVPLFSREASLQGAKNMEHSGLATTSLHEGRHKLQYTLCCKQEFQVISLEVQMSLAIQAKQISLTTYQFINLAYFIRFIERTAIFYFRIGSHGCKMGLFRMSFVKVFFFVIHLYITFTQLLNKAAYTVLL